MGMCSFCGGEGLFEREGGKEGHSYLKLCLFRDNMTPVQLVCKDEWCDEEGRIEIAYCPMCGEKIGRRIKDVSVRDFKEFLYPGNIKGCNKLVTFTADVDGKEYDMLAYVSDKGETTLLFTNAEVEKDKYVLRKIADMAKKQIDAVKRTRGNSADEIMQAFERLAQIVKALPERNEE